MRIIKLTDEEQDRALAELLKRSPVNYTEYEKTVGDIISDVRMNGDSALLRLEKKFDKC